MSLSAGRSIQKWMTRQVAFHSDPFMWKKLVPVLTFVLGAGAVAAGAMTILRAREAAIRDYVKEAHRIEREFATKVPIYEDFATPEMEMNLRRYLLLDHLRVAEKEGIGLVESDAEVQKLVKDGRLVPARMDEETAAYHFHNVPKENRYLTPRAREGLELIAKRFQDNLAKRASGLPPVRIAISSVLRTTGYQRDLQKKNANASFASSHSYGVSFDIFYDDYYVKLAAAPAGVPDELRTRLGYLMGDSLMRQFRAVLIETLLELQKDGEIYAILEKNQRCYHVTVLAK